MSKTTFILEAAAFAAHAHRSQRRKCKGEIPYINHPLEVAELLASVGGVTDPDVLAAALLHDTVEDTEVMPVDILRRFGARVAQFVDEVTDDKRLPKAERKRLQIEHAPHMSPEAQQIKLADKLHNIRSISTNPPEVWGEERIRQYLEWANKVVAGLRGCNPDLERAFDMALEQGRERWKKTD